MSNPSTTVDSGLLPAKPKPMIPVYRFVKEGQNYWVLTVGRIVHPHNGLSFGANSWKGMLN